MFPGRGGQGAQGSHIEPGRATQGASGSQGEAGCLHFRLVGRMAEFQAWNAVIDANLSLAHAGGVKRVVVGCEKRE